MNYWIAQSPLSLISQRYEPYWGVVRRESSRGLQRIDLFRPLSPVYSTSDLFVPLHGENFALHTTASDGHQGLCQWKALKCKPSAHITLVNSFICVHILKREELAVHYVIYWCHSVGGREPYMLLLKSSEWRISLWDICIVLKSIVKCALRMSVSITVCLTTVQRLSVTSIK